MEFGKTLTSMTEEEVRIEMSELTMRIKGLYGYTDHDSITSLEIFSEQLKEIKEKYPHLTPYQWKNGKWVDKY